MSAVFVCIGGVSAIRHLGWWWNPYEQQWEAQAGPDRRIIAPGYDLTKRPRFSVWQVMAS